MVMIVVIGFVVFIVRLISSEYRLFIMFDDLQTYLYTIITHNPTPITPLALASYNVVATHMKNKKNVASQATIFDKYCVKIK